MENNLGFLYGTIKRFPEAHEHLDRAQALFTSVKDKAHIAQVDDTRARVLLAEGRTAYAEKLAGSAVRALEGGDQHFLLTEALTTHGTALARLGRHPQARLTLQSAIEVAHNAGDVESSGSAALTIIEEMGEHLTADDLSLTYERAADLLAVSCDPKTLLRLSECARRVLFLVGTLPGPPIWKGFSLKAALRRYEARIIERALKDAGGIVTRAAKLLGFKNHNSLIKKLNTQHPELLRARTPAKPRRCSLMFVQDTAAQTQPLAILHVEDNHLVAGTVREGLEMEGWAVETCGNGIAALHILRSETQYDVLIFDNKLPGMDGIELIRQMRQLPHRQQTPTIMLSASDCEKESRRAGANVFLRKPEDITAIAATIARLLARQTKQIGSRTG